MKPEQWICANCMMVGPLTQHGYCSTCGSDSVAVASMNKAFVRNEVAESIPTDGLTASAQSLEAVAAYSPDGQWRTLPEITYILGTRMGVTASEAGVSARLRDLRKMKYKVEKRRRSGNLWEYRVER